MVEDLLESSYMSFFKAEDGSLHVERRSNARFRLATPVELHLPSGTRQGQLSDLSEGGAKISIDNPPSKGATVKLCWANQEEFCRVIWTGEKSCGVKFERAISSAIVLETMGQDEDLQAGPVADRSNIPLGRKRRRLGAGG